MLGLMLMILVSLYHNEDYLLILIPFIADVQSGTAIATSTRSAAITSDGVHLDYGFGYGHE